MKFKELLSSAIIAVIVTGISPPARATNSDTPDGFVRHLYEQYLPGKKPIDFIYPVAKPIVDKELLQLLWRDAEKHKGEVGALDGDPICQCQDWGPFKLVSVKTVSSGGSDAVVEAKFINGSGQGADRETVRFDLVRADGGWKIHDIHSKDTPSLVELFRTDK